MLTIFCAFMFESVWERVFVCTGAYVCLYSMLVDAERERERERDKESVL